MVLESPLWQQANTYSAQADRHALSLLAAEGTTTQAGLKVSQRGAGANMSVDVAVGSALIAGDDQINQGSYLVRSTAIENLPIGAAPGVNSRIDLVYAQVRDATVTGGVSSDWVIAVLPGTVAAVPVAPTVPPTAIALATILVPAGKTSIVTADITDARDIANRPAVFDPGAVATKPSAYPVGVSVGLTETSNGWPVLGTVMTARRGGRVFQTVKGFDSALGTTPTYSRQGVFGAGVDGWGPFQREDLIRYVQTIDLPSIPANSTVNVDVGTTAGTIATTSDTVVYISGLTSHGLVMQRVLASAADTIQLRVSNLTASAIDQTASTFIFLIAGRSI